MESKAIRLRLVRKAYRHYTLDGISLELTRGRTLGLVGQNGAGKSTLLRILLGLVRADAGEIEVLGWRMPEEEPLIKARVGFVSEDMALYGSATLEWHMDFIRTLYPNWDRTRATELLDRFSLRPEQKIRGMSRGQQVKALLLLTLARSPDLLILDEPTAGLDPIVRQDVLNELKTLKEAGRSLIFSSHRGEDVEDLADDVAFLHGGRLVAHAETAQFVRGGRRLEQTFLEIVSAQTTRRAA